MKILIVYSKEGKIEEYADALRKGAESKGHQVTMKKASERGDMVSCHPYDLLIVGSPILGVFGGKIAEDLKPYLSALKRTEGQNSIAFVKRKIFGTDKALRRLMGVMESQGCIVKDFRGFRSLDEAYQFGRHL
ncbi:hypothetical protein BBF96_12005 [Anoxybacter fermentans]|uniref:Flavodoxin-like domain-containing protein n=1 Tax=Anoxybacter fermentans TaxID=1323375 RepID=A0A3S9T0H1_9FIRM|nr:flavodoxin family protein [Anoxybacter fermentans]AZR74054.1 hypothetical protein BBF96_12005 [Anoxybacter fermentans]